MGQSWPATEGAHHQPAPEKTEYLRLGGTLAGQDGDAEISSGEPRWIPRLSQAALSSTSGIQDLAVCRWRWMAQGRGSSNLLANSYSDPSRLSSPLPAGAQCPGASLEADTV